MYKKILILVNFLLLSCGQLAFASGHEPESIPLITIKASYHWLVKSPVSFARYFWPAIGPNSTHVVFTRFRSNHKFPSARLWLLTIKSRKQIPLTPENFPYDATRANWSLKNNLVAFTALSNRHPAFIMTVNPNSPSHLNAYLLNYSTIKPAHVGWAGYLYPTWFPDGKSFAVMFSNIKVTQHVTKRFNICNNKLENLTDPKTIYAGMPAVSPDGMVIAFAGQKISQAYHQLLNKVWIKPLNGKAFQLEPYQGRTPSWSPDGKWIIFQSNYGNIKGNYSVHIRRSNGTGPIYRIQIASNIVIQHPKWSPNGKFIIADAIEARKPLATFTDYMQDKNAISGIILIPMPKQFLLR